MTISETRAMSFKLAWDFCHREHGYNEVTKEPIPACYDCERLAQAIIAVLEAQRERCATIAQAHECCCCGEDQTVELAAAIRRG